MSILKSRWGFFGLFAAMAFAVQTAQAQTDPAEVARRTIESINRQADRCVENMRTLAQQAARRINALQAEGHQDQARQAAQRAIGELDLAARRCSETIHREAQNSINLLRRLNAPDRLIQAVRNAAAEATGRVQRAHDAGVQTVREALRD